MHLFTLLQWIKFTSKQKYQSWCFSVKSFPTFSDSLIGYFKTSLYHYIHISVGLPASRRCRGIVSANAAARSKRSVLKKAWQLTTAASSEKKKEGGGVEDENAGPSAGGGSTDDADSTTSSTSSSEQAIKELLDEVNQVIQFTLHETVSWSYGILAMTKFNFMAHIKRPWRRLVDAAFFDQI